jgi:hypothetical protein
MDLTLNHNGIPVTILNGPYTDDDKPTALSVQAYTSLIARLDELRRFASKTLLRLYNDAWINDEIGGIDEKQFMARLINRRVTLYDELGSAVVYFDDSGLFAGHYIEVSIQNGEPVGAGVIG